jgi:hypothetical protein
MFVSPSMGANGNTVTRSASDRPVRSRYSGSHSIARAIFDAHVDHGRDAGEGVAHEADNRAITKANDYIRLDSDRAGSTVPPPANARRLARLAAYSRSVATSFGGCAHVRRFNMNIRLCLPKRNW